MDALTNDGQLDAITGLERSVNSPKFDYRSITSWKFESFNIYPDFDA